jgi:hypothetical protein
MKSLAFVVTLIAVSLGCGGEGSPSAPSAVPGPPPPPATAVRSLFGYVSDTAFRAVGGASVEVVSGQHAGMVTVSDAAGRFAFDQDVASPSTVRASKDGYAIGTGTSVLTSDGRAYVSFSLAALSPPAAIAGSYTLTIAAGSACADLPGEVRTRTYQATIVRALTTSAPANTRFDGTVTGGQFAAYGNLFYVGVFGDYVSFSTEGEGPTIVEHLGGNRYVTFNGAAGALVGPDGVATISVPFAGTIEYCELTSPIGQYYDCSAAKAAVRHECLSTGHQMTLARR